MRVTACRDCGVALFNDASDPCIECMCKRLQPAPEQMTPVVPKCTAGDGTAIPCRHCGAPVGVLCYSDLADRQNAAMRVALRWIAENAYENEIAKYAKSVLWTLNPTGKQP